MLDPRDYFAQHPQGSRYAIPWTLWYVSNGKDGQEPPESQKQRMKLFDDARATADMAKRARDHEADLRHRGGGLRDRRHLPRGHDLRHREEQPGKRAGEDAERMVVAEPRPVPCRSSFLHET